MRGLHPPHTAQPSVPTVPPTSSGPTTSLSRPSRLQRHCAPVRTAQTRRPGLSHPELVHGSQHRGRDVRELPLDELRRHHRACCTRRRARPGTYQRASHFRSDHRAVHCADYTFAPTCRHKKDLFFVLDDSTSVDSPQFAAQKLVVAEVSRRHAISTGSSDSTRVGSARSRRTSFSHCDGPE